MPWYAVLKNLPSGYRNDVQKVWYVGKTYRVSSYNHDTTAVHTDALEYGPDATKEWRISKAMARRLFDKPYYIADDVKEDATIVFPDNVPTMQPYQLQILDALYKLKKEQTDSLIDSRKEIEAIKRELEQTLSQSVDDSVFGNLYDSQGNDRFHGY